jgi:hypothetical protein
LKLPNVVLKNGDTLTVRLKVNSFSVNFPHCIVDGCGKKVGCILQYKIQSHINNDAYCSEHAENKLRYLHTHSQMKGVKVLKFEDDREKVQFT